jgi:hypothetical protein
MEKIPRINNNPATKAIGDRKIRAAEELRARWKRERAKIIPSEQDDNKPQAKGHNSKPVYVDSCIKTANNADNPK